MVAPEAEHMYNPNLSSVQILPNDNLLVCAGNEGYSFELNEEREFVWEYITPFKNGLPSEQGQQLSKGDNATFRLRRYPKEYAGFIGKDLSPSHYIEDLPNTDLCEKALNLNNDDIESIIAYPNPTLSFLNIQIEDSDLLVEIYNTIGHRMPISKLDDNDEGMKLDLSLYPSGMYFIKLNQKQIIRVIKI